MMMMEERNVKENRKTKKKKGLKKGEKSCSKQLPFQFREEKMPETHPVAS